MTQDTQDSYDVVGDTRVAVDAHRAGATGTGPTHDALTAGAR